MNDAENRAYVPVETFRTYCKKYRFRHAGLFGYRDGYFLLTKACGLDAETVASSVSSRDFWEGTLPGFGKWHSFSTEEKNINQFYQFFSQDMISKLKALHFTKFATEDDTYVFFIAQLEGENKMNVEEIDLFRLSTEVLRVRQNYRFDNEKIASGLKLQPCNLFEIRLSDAINKEFEKYEFATPVIQDAIYSTVYNELYDYLQVVFSGRNIITSLMDTVIHCAVFSKEEINKSLLLNQLKASCSTVIAPESFTEDCMTESLFTDSSSEIESFLLGD